MNAPANNPEIMVDAMAATPIAPEVWDTLVSDYNFSSGYLFERVGDQCQVIRQHLGRVGVALGLAEWQHESPGAKLAHDTDATTDLIRSVGPANKLHNGKGFDAGIDLGHMIHMLESDYAALPDTEQQPHLRMPEALLREELALLWHPNTPLRFADSKYKGFMYDLEDPNVFSPSELELPESDRWKIIGMELCNDAADIFQDIYEAPETPIVTRLEALCRQTDMDIRSLRIQASLSYLDQGQQDELLQEMDRLNVELTKTLADVSREPSTLNLIRADRGVGTIFEMFAVTQEREKLMQEHDFDHLVRLASAHEGRQLAEIRPLVNRDGVAVLLPTDVIIEHIDGTETETIELKAFSRSKFEAMEAEAETHGRPIDYLATVRTPGSYGIRMRRGKIVPDQGDRP